MAVSHNEHHQNLIAAEEREAAIIHEMRHLQDYNLENLLEVSSEWADRLLEVTVACLTKPLGEEQAIHLCESLDVGQMATVYWLTSQAFPTNPDFKKEYGEMAAVYIQCYTHDMEKH